MTFLPKLLSTLLTVGALVKLFKPDDFLKAANLTAPSVSSSPALAAAAALHGGVTLAAASALCTVRDQKTALSVTSGWLVVAATHYYEILYGGYANAFSPLSMYAPGLMTLGFVAMLASVSGPHAKPAGAFGALSKLLAVVFFAASVWMYRDPAGFLDAVYGGRYGDVASTEAARYHNAHTASFLMFLSAAVCTCKDVKSALSLGSGVVLGITGPLLLSVYNGSRDHTPFPAVVGAIAVTALFAVLAATAPTAAENPAGGKGKKGKDTKKTK